MNPELALKCFGFFIIGTIIAGLLSLTLLRRAPIEHFEIQMISPQDVEEFENDGRVVAVLEYYPDGSAVTMTTAGNSVSFGFRAAPKLPAPKGLRARVLE